MMMDVDYLSRIHNELIKSHVSIANRLSLADRAPRLEAYSETILDSQPHRGHYSVKNDHAKINESDVKINMVSQVHENQKITHSASVSIQCFSPSILQYNTRIVRTSKWR